jgi:hypothetical protein
MWHEVCRYGLGTEQSVQTIRERLGQHWLGIDQIDCMRAVMLEEHLTVDQCDELAKALREDAVRLTRGSERENLLQLAEGYRVLADMKRMVLRKVN